VHAPVTINILPLREQLGERSAQYNNSIFAAVPGAEQSTVVEHMADLTFGSGDSKIVERDAPENTHLIIRQKRYKRRSKLAPQQLKYFRDCFGNEALRESFLRKRGRRYLNKNVFIGDKGGIEDNRLYKYNLYKKIKRKDDRFSFTFNKRLLRTKRILVLPISTNINLITSSFDVVHSWYIPGLGLKFDCIPGRLIHHALHFDRSGFYYGQCAEICGRYHHHMPVRVCALPFEQFCV